MRIFGVVIANFAIIAFLLLCFFIFIFIKDYIKRTVTRIALSIGYLLFNMLTICFWYKWFSIFSLVGIIAIVAFFIFAFFISMLDSN